MLDPHTQKNEIVKVLTAFLPLITCYINYFLLIGTTAWNFQVEMLVFLRTTAQSVMHEGLQNRIFCLRNSDVLEVMLLITLSRRGNQEPRERAMDIISGKNTISLIIRDLDINSVLLIEL